MNICLMKNVLNDKKVRGGVNKEYIFKNDKNNLLGGKMNLLINI